MIKKFFSALLVVLFATSVMAQSGLTCEDPIPVNKNFTGTIAEPGEYWFTAWSYDLPLTVHFSPESDSSKLSPEVYVDFTCVPGVYDDPKLDSVINGYTDFGIELPVEFLCDEVVRNGKVEWDLSINENYRENLTSCGITTNVQAFVKVRFSEPGRISLQPDTAYQSCMENSEFVNLGDTFDIVADDTERVFVLPYSEWKKDSIQFTWTGDQPATVWVSDGSCDFTPAATSVYVKAQYNLVEGTPYKLQPSQIESAVKNWLGGGVFFAKVITKGTGKLVVEKVPLGQVQGDAILLEYGKPVSLQANDDRVFCFPKGWKSTEFNAATNFVMNMYVSNTVDFKASSDDANVIATYAFGKDGNKRQLQLSTKDISTLATSASDDYLYVRFQCNTATTLTLAPWNCSSCVANSILVTSGQTFSVSTSSNDVYRLVYDDWKNYDLTMQWTGRSALTSTFASYCNFATTATDVLDIITIPGRKSATILSSVIDSWESSIEEGFVYFRLSSSRQGNLTMTTTKPAEEDPEIITNECVEGSIKLNVGDQITLNLDSAFTVYCFNYAEWAAQNVTFQWAGEEALHTFVAETCQFAVAPYNKYVVNYVAIPAQGKLVLDAATLAAFADKVDDAGYLYIRFLTEKEGTLTIK